MSDFADQLSGGNRRSIGQADGVATAVRATPTRVSELWRCLQSDNPLIRMRAADALEKLSRTTPELLQCWKGALLDKSAEDGTPEVRWNLIAIIPRLQLTEEEATTFAERLAVLVDNDPSRIVRATALDAMVSLALNHSRLVPEAGRLLAAAVTDYIPSVRARARKLLTRGAVRDFFVAISSEL